MDEIDSIMSTRQASENEASIRGSSAKKVLVREAESYLARRLIVGTWRNHHAIRSTTSDMEVDAALDLSHTQNIGRMIKVHFPHSQFIVVFSKEGMFNNANVLFWTKFVDGVYPLFKRLSHLSRTSDRCFSTCHSFHRSFALVFFDD